MKAPSKGLKRIIMATSVAVFALAGAVGGTYAWFEANIALSMNASYFQVTSLDASIASVTLYKFNYALDEHGGYDYLFPEDGSVGAYLYDDSIGRKGFGEEVVNAETGEREWHPVSVMNLYDPLNGFITGRGLIGLNCNAVFKIVLHSRGLANSGASIDVRASDIRSTREKTADQIWLSTCVDFDLFLPSDLSDPRLVTEGYKNYLPSESSVYLPQDYDFENQYEEDYYKFSYLASLKQSHAHLYGSAEPSVSIGTADIAFVDGYATFYVNVNYAPSELTSYEDKVTPEMTVEAIYDFLLEVR